jgi:hypothetical protein
MKVEDSAGIINVFRQALIEDNGCSGGYAQMNKLG